MLSQEFTNGVGRRVTKRVELAQLPSIECQLRVLVCRGLSCHDRKESVSLYECAGIGAIVRFRLLPGSQTVAFVAQRGTMGRKCSLHDTELFNRTSRVVPLS